MCYNSKNIFFSNITDVVCGGNTNTDNLKSNNHNNFLKGGFGGDTTPPI